MDHDKTVCQSPPECPKLCVNNCGFYGSAATMNMCSKCHKAMVFQQEQGVKFASAVSGTSSNNIVNETLAAATAVTSFADVESKSVEPMAISVTPSANLFTEVIAPEAKLKEGPSRCSSCNKRVGLTGFKCRCGNLFCGSHRYADKHECSFNYHAAAQEAIAKANPVVKAEKLDKI